MKKITLILGVLSMISIVSCKKKEDKPMTPQVETTTVTTPASPAASEQAKDSTSIRVGTDGVNVTSKTGGTKVNVSGGEATIEIKK